MEHIRAQQFPLTQPSPFAATLSGFAAIVFWSPAALLLAFLTHVPMMLVLGISFSVCFIIVAMKLSLEGSWSCVKSVPRPLWFAGVLGIYGNNICYLIAIKYVPIAHVVLIAYFWPITIMLLSYFFLQKPVTAKQLIAGVIAFTGVAILIQSEGRQQGVYPQYYLGYLLAMGSGTLWAIYCVVSQNYQQARSEFIGLYCGIGAIISLAVYFTQGQYYQLMMNDVLLIIALGLTAFGLAFLFWDHGMKYGHSKLLCVSAFFIPIISTLLLILFGKAHLTQALMIALACVTTGAYMAKS